MKKKVRKMVALILAAAMVIPSASLTLAAGAKPVSETTTQEAEKIEAVAEPEAEETGSTPEKAAREQDGGTGKPEGTLQQGWAIEESKESGTKADQTFKEEVETPAGMEETIPGETGTNGKAEAENENLLTLTGTVTAAKPGDPPTALAGILVRFYDAAAYDKHADTHPYAAEAVTKEDGTYQAEGLAPGEYRVEFVSRNETFQPERYTLEPLPEDAGYEVRMWADELEEERPFLQEEDVYVACIHSVGIWEPGELNLALVEKEAEEQKEPAPETGDSEASAPGGSEHTELEVTPGTEGNTDETEQGSEGGSEYNVPISVDTLISGGPIF